MTRCSSSFSGKNYNSENSSKFIKFINYNTLILKLNTNFSYEECEYKIKDKKIKVTRKLFGKGQIRYINILQGNKLSDNDGDVYIAN